MPRFSIIMPCYNAAETLGATLDSLRHQGFRDWELIAIDDGSRDATVRILTEAAALDPRIRIAHNPRRGPSSARNHGALALAMGEILAFCDADDLWAPDKLYRLARAFDAAPDTDGFFGRVAFFETNPARPSTISARHTEALTIPVLLGENPVCTMSNLAIRRQSFRRSGGFDERLVHNEDLEWLVRITGSGARIEGIDWLLTFYRSSATGLSADLPAMLKGRAAAIETAALFGFVPGRHNEAIFLRYLARRALRLDQGPAYALRLSLSGLLRSPSGFFSDPRRGLLTATAALIAIIIPGALRRRLFS